MTWFKVDDKAHANTKIRKVLAEEPAALALWLVAGSWVADELNDGFVPDTQLPWLMPAGADVLAQKLVTARLWRRVRGGYKFHEWHADGDGTKRNPTRKEVLQERQKKAEAGRLGGLASGKTRSRRQAGASASALARAEAKPKHGGLNSRPSPSKEGSGDARAAPPAAPRVPPAVNSPPNGAVVDPQRVAQLAAEVKANIRRPKTRPGRHKPVPDKETAALAALDAAIAEQGTTVGGQQ